MRVRPGGIDRHALLIAVTFYYNRLAMSYRLLQPAADTTSLWTEEEKTERLNELFKHRDLILPDDDFYSPVRDAKELEKLAAKLKRQLGLRTKKIRLSFSSELSSACLIEIDDRRGHIIVSSRYLGNPQVCAALLAHALCHYSLIVSHKICFADPTENEKLADLATVQTGLGIIMLNGIWSAGWRGLFRKWFGRKNNGGLGYFNPRSYAVRLCRYLTEESLAPAAVAAHSLPWVKKLITSKTKLQQRDLPDFVVRAQRLHSRSLERFVVSCLIILSFMSLGAYVAIRRPAFLSDELRTQKQKIDTLYASYGGCAARVEDTRRSYDTSDQSIQRVVDAELTECKSLENRYNYEVEAYNRMRQNYDRY